MIKVSCLNNFKLYLMRWFGCGSCNAGRCSKLWRMYETGEDRLEKELNIVKIIKNLRNLTIWQKHHVLSSDAQLRNLIENSRKNVIEIDTPSNSDFRNEPISNNL